MKDNDKKNTTTELTAEQQKAIIDTKEVLASKQEVLMAIGQVQAFGNVKKYSNVAELLLFKNIKENKQYMGLTYFDENQNLRTVGDIKELCQYFFHKSYSSMAEGLQNLETFGQEFLESSQNMGLGNRELRKLRQLPSEEQALIINNESVDLGDKEAVKELIEDYTFQHVTEKAELKKQLDEANQTVDAVRETSMEKQQELDEVKEREAKRRFSQQPWERQTLDSVNAMLDARGSIAQGNNQLIDVLNNLSHNHELDDEAIAHIARSLLSEVQLNLTLLSELTNDVFAILGGKYSPDLTVDDLFNRLNLEQPVDVTNV